MSGSKQTARLTCLTKHFWDGRALLTNAFRLSARSPSITKLLFANPEQIIYMRSESWGNGRAVEVNGINKLVLELLK